MERIGLAPGSEVGGYTVVAPLGSGGMGTVYRAVDGAGQAVALKLLHPYVSADPVARDRLRREVLALQRLHHPGVAAVLDAEADSADAFIVTDLVDGTDLDRWVRDHGPLGARELYAFAAGLRGTLRAVHAAGVVHRDLKPTNVLVTADGPVLIDFGIAQAAGAAPLTSTGLVLGTPGYLAPEVLAGGDPGPGADWWSWAAVLVFAATGRPPFGGGPVEAVVARARGGEVDVDGLGRRTAAALRAALAPRPAGRLDADGVVGVLAQVADGDADPLPGILPTVAPGADQVAATRALPGTAAPTTTSAGAAAGRPDDEDLGVGDERVDDVGDEDADQRWPAGSVGAEQVDAGRVRPPARRRWGTVAALGVLAAVAAGLFPGWTAVASVVAVLVARTVGSAVEALYDRRARSGARRGDTTRTVLAVPWHAARALVGALPSLVVGAGAGVVVGGVLWWLVESGRWLPGGPGPDGGPQDGVRPAVVALAAAVGLAAAWWGPASRLTRTGARRALAAVAPGRSGAAVVVLLALACAVVLVLRAGQGASIVWAPLPTPVVP